MNIEELKRLAEAANAFPPNENKGTDSEFRSAVLAFEQISTPSLVLELIRQRDELLAAMKEICTLGHNYTQVSHRVWKIADAAISKVEGGE